LLAPAVVDYLVAEVECLVADGRADEARQLLADEGPKYDRDGTIEVLSAQVALLLGDERAATAHLRRAMDLVKDASAVAGRYGTLLSKVGRHTEALAVLGPLVDKHEGSAQASLVRSMAGSLLALGQYDDARRVLFARMRTGRDEAWCWLLLARVAIAQGDLPTTRRCAAEVHRLRPGDWQAQLIDGYVNWKEGDLAAAERALAACLTAQPRDSLALCLMGEVLQQDGRIESACQHFRRALQIEPMCRWARLRLAELDAQRNQPLAPPKRVLGQATKKN
jgi:predicted Zn-dependent protease